MNDFKASRKIGVKLLDPVQLENAFPQYDDLMRNIELQRERAELQNDGFQSTRLIEQEYYLMHDNIFGIFGGRGSGKTSVLFSLREIFLQQGRDKADIVLPVIMPEIINNECTLLGWVLAMFGDVVGEIEGEIKKKAHIYSKQDFMCRADIGFFESCRFNSHNGLKEEYNLIYKECFSDTSVITDQYSYTDALNIKADQSRRQYKLIQRLNKFWNLLVETKYQMEQIRIKEEGRSDKALRPLIIIMFDDIDLAPERSMELLTSAFKCFSNPNVVILISAAMKTLQHVLLCKMYEKVVGSHFSSLLQDPMAGREAAKLYEVDKAKKAAEEYLNKVIPPSSRFFLERYDTSSQKLLFSYSREWEIGHYDPRFISSKPIAELLTELVNDFGGWSEQNFLLSRGKQLNGRSSFVTAYLLLFGSKNRYIFNGCLVIINTLEKLKRIKEKKGDPPYTEDTHREIYFVLKHLLSVLVASKEHGVIDYQQYLEEFLLLRKNEWDLYINYALLLEIYEKESLTIESKVKRKYKNHNNYMDSKDWQYLLKQELKEELEKIKQSVGALFVTLFFVENLLRLMFPARGAIHGYREIIEFLNKNTTASVEGKGKNARRFIQLFRDKKRVEDILEDYGLVLEAPKAYIALDLFDYRDIRAYFINAYPDKGQMEELEPEKLAESCQADFKWSKTVLGLLFTYQSGLLLVDRAYHHRYELLLDSLIWWEYGDIISNRVSRAFENFLGQNLIREYSMRKIEQFQAMLNKHRVSVPSEAQSVEIGQGLEEMFRKLDNDRDKEELLQKQCGKLWKEVNLRYDFLPKNKKGRGQDFNQQIVVFTESIIEWVGMALSFNDFVVRVTMSQQPDIWKSIEEIMDLSPAVQEKGRKILEQLEEERESSPDCRFIDFEDFFSFMVEVRSALKKSTPDMISYYISNIKELVESCLIYEAAGGERREKGRFGMADLVLNLHLLYYLASFYFAAQFLIAENRQYDTWRLRTQGEQGEEQEDRFAAVYQRIVHYVEKPGNRSQTLIQTFRQAKNEVIADYQQRIEG